MTFGEIVKQRRRASGMTLEQVARKIGSHKGYISGIENGKVRPPSPKVVRRLCSALTMDYKEMLVRGWVEKAPKDLNVNVERVLCAVSIP